MIGEEPQGNNISNNILCLIKDVFWKQKACDVSEHISQSPCIVNYDVRIIFCLFSFVSYTALQLQLSVKVFKLRIDEMVKIFDSINNLPPNTYGNAAQVNK